MVRSRTRSPKPRNRSPGRATVDRGDSAPLVEISLAGVDAVDWVTETLRAEGIQFRLLACRPNDRGRQRLLRLFEVEASGGRLAPLLERFRARLPARDVATADLGPDHALLRVAVPLPSLCSAAFELGDFCVSCPFLSGTDGAETLSWNVLVPQIGDARRLLRSATRVGASRPRLVRAGAFRKQWGLTGHQERAMRVAFQLGYFSYPRKVSLSTVAGRLGVGRSTALELLRKATTKLAAQRFLAQPPVDRLS